MSNILYKPIFRKEGENIETQKEILEYLNKNGISQTFISKRTGIELSKLSLSLRGFRKLSLDEYALICGVLGVNTDKFLKPRLLEEKGV